VDFTALKIISETLHREYLKGKYHCTVDLLFDLLGLVCFANKNKKIVSCHTADSKPVKQEVDGTVILPPFSIPCLTHHYVCFAHSVFILFQLKDRFEHSVSEEAKAQDILSFVGRFVDSKPAGIFW
jgi:hypothetical protein